MSFLNTGYSATVAVRLTQKGRNSIAKGNFVVSYFAVGDSEYNYNTGTTQNILAPFDKDSHVKYPLWYTSGSTFFGIPVDGSNTTICKNLVTANSDWTLSTVWDKNPIGDSSNSYTNNAYVGVKNLLGYSSSSGQTYNTGTTIYDTFGTGVTISPEEQKAIAILHYTQSGTTGDPYRFFKYDDYICIDNTSGQTLFNVTLSSIMYHRLTGATSGATFTMGTDDKKMVSNYNSRYELPYRDLVDYTGNTVGKIFHNQKLVVFDDEEIVAALDTGSTRNYTLTAPKVDVLVTNNNPITGLTTTGKTMWVTYKFSGGTVSDDLPCNYFMKVTGSTNDENVTVKFNSGGFKHLNNGYTATQFHILYQLTDNGVQPTPNSWKIKDFTSESGLGGNVDNLKTGHTFTINQSNLPTTTYSSSLSSFGVDRALSGGTITGTVTLVRASDIEEMDFKLNLPEGKFTSSQNPTYTSGDKKITEVALLNTNKEVLAMGKLATPLTRSGNQVIEVKLDF